MIGNDSKRVGGGRRRFLPHASFSAPRAQDLVTIVGLALAVRLALGFSFPSGGGDSDTYAAVALNILENFCVSLSLPEDAACIPHWGGNQLPGYPAFIAFIWLLFGESEWIVRAVQGLVEGVAIGRLVYAMQCSDYSRRAYFVVGVVLAISPVGSFTSRFFLTESLAAALTIWFFAEILLSLAERRLRVMTLAVVLTAAVYVRLDAVTLAVPVVIAAAVLYPPWQAFQRLVLIGLICAVALGAWVARSYAHGLGLIPQIQRTNEFSAPAPHGFFRWTTTWMAMPYHLRTVSWPVVGRNYTSIQLPDNIYRSDTERERVTGLITRLHAYENQPFPRSIDRAFEDIASQRIAEAPWERWIATPGKRLFWLWLNPLTSLGWPAEAEGPALLRTYGQASGLVGGLWKVVLTYPAATLGKAISIAYRSILLCLFALVIVLAFRSMRRVQRSLVAIAFSLIAARALFYALIGGFESRYMVPVYPVIEATVFLSLVASWPWRHASFDRRT